MFEVAWIEELLLVLATAGVVVPLFGRLRFGVVPGFLLAGLILGPGGLGSFADALPWLGWVTFSDPEAVRPIAELGVLFLLFFIGLEFSFERLWSMRRMVFGIGSGQVVASAILIVVALLWLLDAPPIAVVIGLAFALSSTAIVTQFLIEAHRFATPVGRTAISVLLFQDLMVVPLVIVVGLLGGSDVAVSDAVLQAILYGAAAIAVIIVAARFLMRPLMRAAAATQSRELLVAIALFLVIGTSLLTAAAGLSPALGAFLAGILLGGSEYRHELEVDIEPFKGLLLGLFFMTVGMTLDVSVLLAHPVILLGGLAALLVVKWIVAYGVARIFGIAPAVALESAFLLAGAGEFAFVLFTLAEEGGILHGQVHHIAVAVAALSMLATPLLGTLGHRLAQRMSDRGHARDHGIAHHVSDLTDHVIIGGFGRVGQAVAGVLEAEQIPYVALDLNADLIVENRQAGRNIFYGDASRREILDRVGGERARAFVVTPNSPLAAERMVASIRRCWPDSIIHARAVDTGHAQRLREAGANDVVPEALEASLLLAGRVLTGVGLPEEAVEASLAERRDVEIAAIGHRADRLTSAGDGEERQPGVRRKLPD